VSIRKAFGQVVYQKRTALGISQMKLAELADLHLNTVNQVEAGAKSVQIETIFKLAKGLGCPAWELLVSLEGRDYSAS